MRLVTLMAHYNEALITMYSGYHPDHFWRGVGERVLRRRKGNTSSGDNADKSSSKNGGQKQAQDAQIPNGSRTNDAPDASEIEALKRQLAEQAKLIEQLAAKVNSSTSFDPQEESQRLESISEQALGHTKESDSSIYST